MNTMLWSSNLAKNKTNKCEENRITFWPPLGLLSKVHISRCPECITWSDFLKAFGWCKKVVWYKWSFKVHYACMVHQFVKMKSADIKKKRENYLGSWMYFCWWMNVNITNDGGTLCTIPTCQKMGRSEPKLGKIQSRAFQRHSTWNGLKRVTRLYKLQRWTAL